jgi:hypothetical protein
MMVAIKLVRCQNNNSEVDSNFWQNIYLVFEKNTWDAMEVR